MVTRFVIIGNLLAALTVGLQQQGNSKIDYFPYSKRRRLRGYGSGSGGGETCPSTCEIDTKTPSLGVLKASCVEGHSVCRDLGGIPIVELGSGCGKCTCCVAPGTDVITSPPPPSEPTKPPPPTPFGIPPQPPGQCGLQQCGKYVPGLGYGLGRCVVGTNPDICSRLGGLPVTEFEGCEANACQCCILQARFVNPSPPPLIGTPPPPPGENVPPTPPLVPEPPYTGSPPVVSGCSSDTLCGRKIGDDIQYGKCRLGSSPTAACSAGVYAGTTAVGCSDDGCYCCVEDSTTPSSPPPAPPVVPSPPTSGAMCNLGGTCGIVVPKGADPILGKCFRGKDPEATCESKGLAHVSSSVGCTDTRDCFCCVYLPSSPPAVTSPPPPTNPSPPLPPTNPSPPPPTYSPPPPVSCPTSCQITIETSSGIETVSGSCVKYVNESPREIQDAVDACYPGNPVPKEDLCGPEECNSVCCIDSASLCGGDQAAQCPQNESASCNCILTNQGVPNPCTTDGGLVHDPDPGLGPTGGGNGCPESRCNAYAAKYLGDFPEIGATCCSFC